MSEDDEPTVDEQLFDDALGDFNLLFKRMPSPNGRSQADDLKLTLLFVGRRICRELAVNGGIIAGVEGALGALEDVSGEVQAVAGEFERLNDARGG